MGKTSTIPGRAAPPSRKATSSISRSTSSSSNPRFSKNNESTVKKAIKLETKRKTIRSKTQDSNPASNNSNRHSSSSIDNKGTNFGPGWVNTLPPTNLSKSSLRRFKRKAREQLAGNRDGMKDMEQALELVEEGDDDELLQDGIEEEEQSKSVAGTKKSSKVGAKRRKEVLSQELLRQPSILKDPSFSSNPFQALRQHARNTLTFDGPVEKLKPGKKQAGPNDMEL